MLRLLLEPTCKEGLPTIANLVILTGAGISRESGLDTFRDAGGVWSQVRLEDVATPEAFHRDPARVHEFYNARRAQLRSGAIDPNEAHRALARLEARWPGKFLLVTQNVDDLHERAGSHQLIHMHGELLKARCGLCQMILPWSGMMSMASLCPACHFEGRMRPHVVWFGEVPLELGRIYAALDQADLFIAIGTSGQVYPAAGFVSHAKNRAGARCIEVNLERGDGSSQFDEGYYGTATALLPDLTERLLAERSQGAV
jgi:NAD-dependent deacetylase